jgi:hypothetical protein
MSKDPLGFDPLGIDPIAHIQQIKSHKLQQSLSAYRNNLLLRGTHMVDSEQTVRAPVGDDGKELTYEKRCELAAKRKPYDPRIAFAKKVGSGLYQLADGSVVDTSKIADYSADLEDHEVEEIGATAQKIIEEQPEITIVTPTELPDPVPSTRPQPQDPE